MKLPAVPAEQVVVPASNACYCVEVHAVIVPEEQPDPAGHVGQSAYRSGVAVQVEADVLEVAAH